MAHVDVERRRADERRLRFELRALVGVEQFPLAVACAREDVEDQALGVACVQLEAATASGVDLLGLLRLELASDLIRAVRRDRETKWRLLRPGRAQRRGTRDGGREWCPAEACMQSQAVIVAEFVILMTARQMGRELRMERAPSTRERRRFVAGMAQAIAEGRRPEGMVEEEKILYDCCMAALGRRGEQCLCPRDGRGSVDAAVAEPLAVAGLGIVSTSVGLTWSAVSSSTSPTSAAVRLGLTDRHSTALPTRRSA